MLQALNRLISCRAVPELLLLMAALPWEEVHAVQQAGSTLQDGQQGSNETACTQGVAARGSHVADIHPLLLQGLQHLRGRPLRAQQASRGLLLCHLSPAPAPITHTQPDSARLPEAEVQGEAGLKQGVRLRDE